MDALLIRGWLSGLPTIPLLDDASVALVRAEVRRTGTALPTPALEAAAAAASELAHNALRHGHGGEAAVRAIARDGVPGVEIIVADRGPGLAHPIAALAGTTAAPVGLGVGLSGVRRLADELDVESRRGEGTCVAARKFAAPVTRRREVGLVGRPIPGETASADAAAFLRDGDALVLALVDGLGHGAAAREPALAAANLVRAEPGRAPLDILTVADVALRRTRGAVMAIARIDEARAELEIAAVGDVSVHAYGHRTARRFAAAAGYLGATGGRLHAKVERAPLAAREALVLFTDGLTTRLTLELHPELLHEHPLVIAQRLLEEYGRDTDDATVLVAR